MNIMTWIDLLLFFVLFALFIYIFASVTITNLHKAYLVFHFTMMLWPFCQFAIKTTDDPKFQLFYVKLAFIDSVLLTIGWLLFTVLLTGKSHLLRKKNTLILYILAALILVGVVANPNGSFVLPMNGGYIERYYGPIFWLLIIFLTTSVMISLYIIYSALVSNTTQRIKKQVAHVFKGVLVLTVFILLDVFLNVILLKSNPVIPGLTSLGILISAIFFVIAIHRDKIFDLVTIAHQDIIDTITEGILVLDDSETVVEINRSLFPRIHLQIGAHFDVSTIAPIEQASGAFNSFLHTYLNQPMERTEVELFYTSLDAYINITAAPIVVGGIRVGRILTFQDRSELHRLIAETNHQNETLQERNAALTEIQDELSQTNQKLKQMAITDSLTGCYNRHYLTLHLEHEIIENMKLKQPFAIILLDIDFFKTVNDNYGHLIGDVVICSTVEVIKKTLRETDVLARYGGEEFIIYLPNTDQTQANHLAKHIKSIIEANKVHVEDVAHSLSITVSMGLLSISNFAAQYTESLTNQLNDLFESVDKALYQAKNAGRNQIVEINR
ncbi:MULTISPECIES: histidine kinase N-terminal 7TM domain-containing diguanylate cyclase [Paenibacillus]|uniref:histidine kinase N-terminal 7TM domain-containing diguanylate cyclase n=1 Tax=Paenibacillus TaxID=44249 RepID=UPI00096C7B89|nr:diguanylate cyclase [Paenibacillus odorifer]OME17104.1 GGDEF domain-containing protein [Paenibacillus odorifer]